MTASLVAVASCSAPAIHPGAPYYAPPPSDLDLFTFSVGYGVRTMSADIWESPPPDVSEQKAVTLIVDHRSRDSIFGIEAGTTLSSTSEGSVDGKTTEIFAGVRATFDLGESNFHPYASLGLSYIEGRLESSGGFGAFTSDDSVGVYARAGIYYTISERLNVGVDVKTLMGTSADLITGDDDLDYVELAVTLGYSF